MIKTLDKFSLFWPYWQLLDLMLPVGSIRPARMHSVDESFVGTERTRHTPVVPDYSYPLECLTFDPLPSTLTLDVRLIFSALSHEGIFHALRLLSADHLHRLALPISAIPAARKHRVAASARRLSAHR